MVSSKQTGFGQGFRVALMLSALITPALAMAQAAPIDPYAPVPPAPPPPPPVVAPQPAPQQPGVSNSGTINNNNNTNTVSPTITANPTNNNSNTSNNTNTNDNRSSATATNNNTIYIYPPAYPPPAPPPIVAPPTAISPPRLVPPPAMAPPLVAAPLYRPQRIRLNCRQLCAAPPPPVLIPSPIRERIRYLSFGTHLTALGMAHQPLAGWGTMYGGGFQVTMRSRGRFGFEVSQDFLHGTFRNSDEGNSITRNSFPIDFTFRGYIMPNLDKHHFNVYFGAGIGAIASTVEVPVDFGTVNQGFLEWSLHADVGAELRYKWIALGLDTKFMGLVRDKNFGDGKWYGNIQDGPVPARTWGLQGRGYLSFWF